MAGLRWRGHWTLIGTVDGMRALVRTSLQSPVAGTRFRLLVAAVVLSAASGIAEEGGVPELPDRLQDQREIEDLERERQKAEIRNEVEALRGLQTTELVTIHDQLKRLKDMAMLDREVRELLLASPELEAIYRDIFQSNPIAPGCECLDRVTLQLVSRAQAGVAVLSLDGQSRNYRQGERIGNTSCAVGAVGENEVAVQCGTGQCVLSLGGRKECDR